MRIIAGEFRGRRLLDPADQATRPITDRVKQSLFDILSPRLPGAHVWDVFAGTGSLGLEALSRGAMACDFFERHRPAVDRLKRNIATLGVENRSCVVARDVFGLQDADWTALPTPGVVFFDPPYPYVRDRASEVKALLARLAARVAAEGQIVFRLEKGVRWESELPLLDERTWGSMRVLFLKWEGPRPRGPSARDA